MTKARDRLNLGSDEKSMQQGNYSKQKKNSMQFENIKTFKNTLKNLEYIYKVKYINNK